MVAPRYMVSTPGDDSTSIYVEDVRSNLRFRVEYPDDHDHAAVREALEQLLNRCPKDRVKPRP